MESYNGKILIIDHEVEICKLLKTRLNSLGYEVLLAYDGQEALVHFSKEKPDLIILEIFLPSLDGYTLYRKIRKNSQVPIIILTALTNISDRLKVLELGVDDYITKPFYPKELEARIKYLLRRLPTPPKSGPNKRKGSLQIDGLKIDLHTRIVSKNNLKIKLTDIEYNLLEFLIENSGNKLSRVQILSNIWGYTPERYVDTRIVDVYIARLRTKIEKRPSNPELILTVRGIGYMFQQY